MSLDPDSLRLSIKVPKPLREFVFGMGVFAMVFIGMGLSALFFRQIGEQPTGGRFFTHWSSYGPALGAGAALSVTGVRWVWGKHKHLLSAQGVEIKDEIKSEIIALKNDLSPRLEVVEGHTAATNGSVAKALELANEAKTEAISVRHRLELFQAELHGWMRGKAGLPTGESQEEKQP